MDRYLVISSDSHAGMSFGPNEPWEQYKQHLERKYWEPLDRYLAASTPRMSAVAAAESREDPSGIRVRALRESAPAFQAGGEAGRYDPAVRAREMDRDGVAAEVVFPQRTPFQPLKDDLREANPYELRLAGVRA